MKQIIHRNSDGTISNKYYENDNGQINSLAIGYYHICDNNIILKWKENWFNNKQYGLVTHYKYNSEIKYRKYFL